MIPIQLFVLVIGVCLIGISRTVLHINPAILSIATLVLITVVIPAFGGIFNQSRNKQRLKRYIDQHDQKK